jgi:acyl-CoA synthetase (AMP-forming)/AMP-acid ligase II
VRPADIPFQRHPADAPALSDARHALDNAAFAAAVEAFAERFSAAALGPGAVLAAMLPNRVELVIAMFAAWRLGAAFTPINPALTASEAGHQIRDSRAALVLVDSATAQVLGQTGAKLLSVETLPFSTCATLPRISVAASDTALLIYTSGSTGRPKGVVLDHANVEAMTRIVAQTLQVTAQDRALLVLPLFHVNALLISILTPLSQGASSLVLERFERHSFWPALIEAKATFFSAVPTIYALLNQDAGARPADLKQVRFAVCGAAPMPAGQIELFERTFGIPLLEGYGLTESTVGATLNPLAGPRKAGSVGVALPGVELCILDDEGRSLPTGQAGEIAIAGPTVMRGYLNQPEATSAVMHGRWLRTGDVGRFDSDGYLTLVDRKKDMIIRGGENIYPTEIEAVLYAHPAVAAAAVVGAPDPVMGEEVVAFVSLKPGQTADAEVLRAFAAARLARFKLPKAFRFMDALPLNAVGKIAKPHLRALLKEELT